MITFEFDLDCSNRVRTDDDQQNHNEKDSHSQINVLYIHACVITHQGRPEDTFK